MADRAVYRTDKDEDGDISALCSNASWSPRSKSDAIEDIESEAHTYYVPWKKAGRTDIQIVDGSTGKYLRTDRDDSDTNNLAELPNC